MTINDFIELVEISALSADISLNVLELDYCDQVAVFYLSSFVFLRPCDVTDVTVSHGVICIRCGDSIRVDIYREGISADILRLKK